MPLNLQFSRVLAVVYHRLPADSDLADLQKIGILGGTRFRVLPAITLTGTREQIIAISKLPQSSYKDVRDASTMLFVESVQASPTGALFIDVSKGGQFRPGDGVTRLAAAVALVRAAGLRPEAETRAGTPLAFLDASGIPSELRGYVSVAVSNGLLQGDSTFRPSGAFTRADLAHAVAVIQKRAIE